MRPPKIDLQVISVLLGWIFVIGGLVETFGLVYYRFWGHRSFAWDFYHGPAILFGLGITLWMLARR